jgi:predicted transcriptional regulator
MRTTVDLEPRLLERAKRLAVGQGRTLSAIVGEALASYLASRQIASKDPPFELLVRGRAGARFPSPGEMAALEEEEDVASLRIPRKRGRAAP